MKKIVVQEVRNPCHHPSGMIAMEVKFEHTDDFIPFSASKDDTMEHGRKLYEDAIAGKFGPIGESTVSKSAYDAGFIRREVWDEMQKVKPELSTLRDCAELGMLTDEESKRYNELRMFNIKSTRFLNSDNQTVLKSEKPELYK